MSLIDDLAKIEAEAKELIANADDAEKLEAARVALLGRKGRVHDGQALPRGASRDGQARQRDAPAG